MTVRAVLLGLAALAAATLAAAAWAASAAQSAGGCSPTGYAYAGLAGERPATRVAATLTPLAAPTVARGHVAAWIGVGGERSGPGGRNEWLQAGLVGLTDGSTRLYYELVRPGSPRLYIELARVRAGETRRVEIAEVAPERWQVRVDGTAVTAPVLLPGSHRAWRPVATTESWSGSSGACNRFAFRFASLRGAGSWVANAALSTSPTAHVTRIRSGFDAAA